jgi:hypothetical protein
MCNLYLPGKLVIVVKVLIQNGRHFIKEFGFLVLNMPKSCWLYGTFFSVKFTLMTYFSVDSTVIYTYMFDISDLPGEEVTDLSAPRTPVRR